MSCDSGYIKFTSIDFEGELTIREYLKLQLITLWEEGERFSGKRPLGNSGWDLDVYRALLKNNIVAGKMDDEGFIEDIDEEQAKKIILDIIQDF